MLNMFKHNLKYSWFHHFSFHKHSSLSSALSWPWTLQHYNENTFSKKKKWWLKGNKNTIDFWPTYWCFSCFLFFYFILVTSNICSVQMLTQWKTAHNWIVYWLHMILPRHCSWSVKFVWCVWELFSLQNQKHQSVMKRADRWFNFFVLLHWHCQSIF